MKTSGRIKAGEGTLIGSAGEYYVMAELLKQGIVAALTPYGLQKPINDFINVHQQLL